MRLKTIGIYAGAAICGSAFLVWQLPEAIEAQKSVLTAKEAQCPKRVESDEIEKLLTKCAEGSNEPLRYLDEANLLASSAEDPLSPSRTRVIDDWLDQVRDAQVGEKINEADLNSFYKVLFVGSVFLLSCVIGAFLSCAIILRLEGNET